MRRLYEWKLMSPQVNNNSATTSRAKEYNQLLTQIRTEKVFTYDASGIRQFNNKTLDINLKQNGKVVCGFSIVYRPDRPNYVVIIYDSEDTEIFKTICNTFEDVLDYLIDNGIIKDKSFYSSTSTGALQEWKPMNPPINNSSTSHTAASNFSSYKQKFEELLKQLDKEKKYTYNTILLNDNALVLELIMDSTRKITIALVYKPFTNPPVWKVGINNLTPVDYKDWNEVLDVFEVPGIINDVSSLKESFSSSIVEEFKEYASMWMTSPQVNSNDLYIIYNDYDDGSYDILYADSDLNTVKEIFKREATDFMLPIANADQTINLLHIKLNELSAIDDKEFISLLARFNKEEWDAAEFTAEENKLFGKYEKLFWREHTTSSKFSVLKSFTDVDAYEEAIDQKLDPEDMTEEEWREFVEEYVEYSVIY